MKVDDIVLYKGKQYKIFFDYQNGQYEIMELNSFVRCILVRREDILKVIKRGSFN